MILKSENVEDILLPGLSKRQTSKKASVIAEQKCEKFCKGKLKNRSKHTNHEERAYQLSPTG